MCKFLSALYGKHFLPRGIIQARKSCSLVCLPLLVHRNLKYESGSGLTTPPLLSYSRPEITRNSCWQVLWRKSNTVWERVNRQEWRSSEAAGGAFCRRGPQIWPWLADEQKNPFPALQTVVSVSVIEGLRIDLNYLGCLEKLSGEEADLKSCNKQHTSWIFLFPWQCLVFTSSPSCSHDQYNLSVPLSFKCKPLTHKFGLKEFLGCVQYSCSATLLAFPSCFALLFCLPFFVLKWSIYPSNTAFFLPFSSSLLTFFFYFSLPSFFYFGPRFHPSVLSSIYPTIHPFP